VKYTSRRGGLDDRIACFIIFQRWCAVNLSMKTGLKRLECMYGHIHQPKAEQCKKIFKKNSTDSAATENDSDLIDL
jgi:hypothetical protein